MKQSEYYDFPLIGIQSHGLTGHSRQRKRGRLLSHLEQSSGEGYMGCENGNQQRAEDEDHPFHRSLHFLRSVAKNIVNQLSTS